MLPAVYNCSRLDFSAGCCDIPLLRVAVLLLATVILLLLAAMVVDVTLVSAVITIVGLDGV